MNKSLLLSLAMAAVCHCASANSIKRVIEENIDNGNLTTAETLIAENRSQLARADIDSLNAIIYRIRQDFSMKPETGIAEILKVKPTATIGDIASWIDNKYIETLTIDGKQMWFRKAVRNLWLLNPDFQSGDKYQSIKNYRDIIGAAKDAKKDKNHCSYWHKAHINYTLDVDADAVPEGEEISAWLPIPLETARQRNFKVISANRDFVKSDGSEHNTVQMKAIAEKGKPTHFEIEFTYDVAAQYFEHDYLLKNVKPYNKESELYKKYTVSDNRHIIVDDNMRNLAKSIVGEEQNPVMQAARIYNWIVTKFPWAGARDYGTLKNIPQYVLDIKHGDCGQVSLLYISLVRSLGIPARWESGWMLHPSGVNWHDWSETYFEGIGWVPTDVSIGRNDDDIVRNYYKTGTDIYRFASNCNYGKPLSPKKEYIRSEPLDFQAGEVEWKGGNIEATHFNSDLTLKSLTPIKY